MRQALKVPLGAPEDLYRNFAGEATLAAAAKKQIKTDLDRARRIRQTGDLKAYRRYKQWAMITDEKFYRGRANAYIPAVRRGVERQVTQWVRETFPTDEWWDIRATAREFEPNV